MSRLTKAKRQAIVTEFAARHDGEWLPAVFVEEVRAAGPDHPAYKWFEWDDEKAASYHRVNQARDFASGLRISFTVEEVGRNRKMVIRKTEMPFVLSPLERRTGPSSYFLVDPENPEHMAEHCRQAARTLSVWLERYGSAVTYAGGSVSVIEKQIRLLEPLEAKEAA